MVGCADLQFPRAVIFSVIWLGCWHEYASVWILRMFVALDAYLTGSICILFFVGYIYWLLTRHIGAKDLRWGMHPWWEPLNGLLMGGGTALYVQPSLWFLPALFVTKLTYQVLSKYVSLERLVLFGGIFSWVWVGFFPGFGVRFPFALDELPIAFLFFVLGVMGRRTSWLRLLPKTRKANMILLAVLLFPWFLLALCNEKVDMNMLIFGNSPFIFHVSALLGVAIVLCMAALVEQWSLVQWAGRNTLLILCTHTLVFFVLFGVLSLLGGTSGLILALLFQQLRCVLFQFLDGY